MNDSGSDPDAQWRRPARDTEPAPGVVPPPPIDAPVQREPEPYLGPPPTLPPPPGWRTPTVVQPAPPRELPAQDDARLDAREAAARTLSLGVLMVAGAIMVLLLLAICARLIF